MKKKLLITVLSSIIALSSFASLRQAEYRWRNDDGNEAAATWKAPSNTSIVHNDINEVLRLRIEFDNQNELGEYSILDQELVYSKDGGASWYFIDESDDNDFKLVPSTHVSHGDVTTNLLGGGLGSFVAGYIASAYTPYLDMDLWDGERTEIEWVIQSTPECENYTTYIFAMYYIEVDEGLYPTLTTNFPCEEPVITMESFSLERCGPGAFELTAAINTEGGIIRWWTSETSGDLLGTGLTFTTPSYSVTTTIYAEGFGGGCYSERIPVELIINPLPVVDIPLDNGVVCAYNNQFAITSVPVQPTGTNVLWNTGATTSSILAGPTFGVENKYWVEVTNEYGCIASDTVKLTINPSPVVDLGPDLVICEGGSTVLDGGTEGVSYYWNTGDTERSLTVESAGRYTVMVTNSYGCRGTDTIYVDVEGFAPEMAGIIVDNLSAHRFRFTPHLPLYIDSYEWDFGDGHTSSLSYPEHTYEGAGTYKVVCVVTSSCAVVTYETYVNIFTSVSSEDLGHSLNIYPNPAKDFINIEVDGSAHMQSIRVTNILGQNVFHDMELSNTKSVAVNVLRLPAGTYYIHIVTDQGHATKTFQVVK